MDKSPGAFRTISEVADDLDLPQHVLRFWEGRFPQIKPLKRGGGRRYYRPDDVLLLKGIKHLLYGQGYTIRGVQRILKEQGPRQVMAIWQTEGGSAAAEDLEPELDAMPPEPQPVARRPAPQADVRVEPQFTDDDDLDDDDLDEEPVAPVRDPVVAPAPSPARPSGAPAPRPAERPAPVAQPVPSLLPQAPRQLSALPRAEAPPAPARSEPETVTVVKEKPVFPAAARQRLEATLRDLIECRRMLDAL